MKQPWHLHQSNLTKESFLKTFEEFGCAIVEGVYEKEQMEATVLELEKAIEIESSQYHSKEHKDYGMLLACPIYGGNFLEVLKNPHYFKPFDWVLGETCIIWVYTTSSLPPNKGNNASQMHVDRPFYVQNFNDSIGSLILLNDFTEDNGATHFLLKSELKADKPDSEHFYANAERLVAPKGSVFYFDLRMWHAGGINHTDEWRHALGIGGVKPYFKQRIDLPRIIKEKDAAHLPQNVKQKLGFYAQPPTSISEYYDTAEIRAKLQPSEWEEE